MGLKDELGLRRGFENGAHEALFNVYFTGTCLRKRITEMLRPHGLTDVQFNMLMLLKFQADQSGGLTQVELSRMMLVNRANITALVDRTAKAGLVTRHPVPGDRRYNTVKLTARGMKMFAAVIDAYNKEIRELTGKVSSLEQQRLVTALGRIRANISRRSGS